MQKNCSNRIRWMQVIDYLQVSISLICSYSIRNSFQIIECQIANLRTFSSYGVRSEWLQNIFFLSQSQLSQLKWFDVPTTTYYFRLAYLWRASKGLFPEIYMSSKAEYTHVKEYIRGQVNETLRVWAKYSTPDTLILPYSLCQDTGTDFFSKVRPSSCGHCTLLLLPPVLSDNFLVL